MTRVEGFRRDRNREPESRVEESAGGEAMETVCEAGRQRMKDRKGGTGGLWVHLPFWGRDSFVVVERAGWRKGAYREIRILRCGDRKFFQLPIFSLRLEARFSG